VLAANQPPDHVTIARFRVRHEQALAGFLVASLKLCAAAGAVDQHLSASPEAPERPGTVSDMAARPFRNGLGLPQDLADRRLGRSGCEAGRVRARAGQRCTACACSALRGGIPLTTRSTRRITHYANHD
jgi:hypothetical protein